MPVVGPRKEKYAPKHRSAPEPAPKKPALKKGLRRSKVLSGVAVAATGIAVGSIGQQQPAADTVDTATSTIETATKERAVRRVAVELVQQRDAETSSRSDRRTSLDAKKNSLSEQPGGMVTKTEDPSQQDPRQIARELLPKYGFSSSEFSCLDALYVSESDWKVDADNPTSSAYGIPQALTDMYDLPADYRTNPVSQIEWGLWYIKDSYGTPCAAWEFKQANDWY